MKNRLLIVALAGVSIFAVAASVYAYRARDSAIRGWSLAAELESRQKVRDARLGTYEKTFKWLISKNAGILSTDSKLEIAKKLTNHLYQTTLFSGTWAPNSEPQMYLQTLDQTTMNYCSSLSVMLDWALGLFGIEGRSVSFAAPNFFDDPAGDTHTLVEVLIDGKVSVFDPTFSTTYSCGETKMIDARQMVECAPEKLGHRYIGAVRPGRSLAEYYVPLTDMLHAISAKGGGSSFYQYEYPHAGWLEEIQKKHAAEAASAT